MWWLVPAPPRLLLSCGWTCLLMLPLLPLLLLHPSGCPRPPLPLLLWSLGSPLLLLLFPRGGRLLLPRLLLPRLWSPLLPLVLLYPSCCPRPPLRLLLWAPSCPLLLPLLRQGGLLLLPRLLLPRR